MENNSNTDIASAENVENVDIEEIENDDVITERLMLNYEEDYDSREFQTYNDFNNDYATKLKEIEKQLGITLMTNVRQSTGKKFISVVDSHRDLTISECKNLKNRGFVLPEHNELIHSASQIPPLSVVTLKLVNLEMITPELENPTGIERRRKIRIDIHRSLINVPSVQPDIIEHLVKKFVKYVARYTKNTECAVADAEHLASEEINILRANLTPEHLTNFVQKCNKNKIFFYFSN